MRFPCISGHEGWCDWRRFYPDFLLWSKQNEEWAIDPKGRHLIEGAVPPKLLDLSGLKNITPSMNVAFILEGSYTIDQQGHL